MKNQIDVTVSDVDQSLVLQSIGNIKLAMPFLTKLSKADRKNLQMMKDGRKPFVEKGLDLASRNNELSPGTGMIDAGNKDIKLFTFIKSITTNDMFGTNTTHETWQKRAFTRLHPTHGCTQHTVTPCDRTYRGVAPGGLGRCPSPEGTACVSIGALPLGFPPSPEGTECETAG